MVASVADVHLGAVAALVMVLGADHRLERLELGVLPVPPAALVRARVVRLDAGRRQLIVEADAASRPAVFLEKMPAGSHLRSRGRFVRT